MKDVQVTELPRCDLCGKPECGVYNSPTRTADPRTGGKWANLCGPCFEKHGLDTSVTERRVLPKDPPSEVKAIALRWVGEPFQSQPLGDGVWRIWGPGTGEIYDVYRPGAEFPCFEDDGRPIGPAVFHDQWAVRALAAAPDDWFTVQADGTYRGHDETVQLWKPEEASL